MRLLGRRVSIALVAVTLVFAVGPEASADPEAYSSCVAAIRTASRTIPSCTRSSGQVPLPRFLRQHHDECVVDGRRHEAGPTTCVFSHDTAGYWFPAAYMGDVRIVPTFSKTYYFGVAGSVVEPIHAVSSSSAATRPPPPGLRTCTPRGIAARRARVAPRRSTIRTIARPSRSGGASSMGSWQVWNSRAVGTGSAVGLPTSPTPSMVHVPRGTSIDFRSSGCRSTSGSSIPARATRPADPVGRVTTSP